MPKLARNKHFFLHLFPNRPSHLQFSDENESDPLKMNIKAFIPAPTKKLLKQYILILSIIGWKTIHQTTIKVNQK